MHSSTTLSRLSSLVSTSSALPCFTRTAVSSPSPSSPFSLVLRRSYEKLSRRTPPRHSHAYFQQLAEQRRSEPPPPNTSASLTHTPPLPPLTVYHAQFHNPYFTRVQQLDQQQHIKRSHQSLDATHTTTAPTHNNTSSGSGNQLTVFAVVELNGAQHKVVEDDLIMADLIRQVEVGSRLQLDNVLLLGSVEWSVIGRPVVPGASVECVVEEHARTDKVLVFHKKRRKNHKKMKGYRGDVTVLRVTKITVPPIEAEKIDADGGEKKQIE